MWRPATKGVSGTNEVPLGGKRRFGLPEEAPPPPGPPGSYNRPPAEDITFFNGRVDRDRVKDERDDYSRDDRRGDGHRDERREQYDRGGQEYRRDESHRYEDRGREREGRGGRWDDERGREPERGRDPAPVDEGPRKRRSRWGDASERVEVPGLPVALTGKVSQAELDNYAIHVRLEEINRKLRTGDVVPPEGQRSPSPRPQYDAYGRRTNTRELRYRKKLEDERLKLVDKAMKSDPNFRPPADVQAQRRFTRPQEKVYIPVKEFPEINFFGLLVGPRGNSLKNMERQSGAKISIRGKGSVKEGKGRPDAWAADEDDELHCLVMSDDEQKVKACAALINKVIETAASTPEGQNDHKRNQLRELASLNGTLRDDENQLCQNCGEKGHRRWECPQQRMYSANVICRLCGGAGHMARDCRGRGDPNLQQNKQTAFDSEYTALMAELGEGGGGGGPAASGRPAGAVNAPAQEQRVPPWRIPENWNTNTFRGVGQAPPHMGFQQGYSQNAGYGYGGYVSDSGFPEGGGGGVGGGGGGGAQGSGDPYASYYASMGQATPAA